MSNFTITDVIEDEIQNGYAVQTLTSNQPATTGFAVSNIIVAEGVNALALEGTSEDLEVVVYAYTPRTNTDNIDADGTYAFVVSDNLNYVAYPPPFNNPDIFRLPNNIIITSINYKNINNIGADYGEIVAYTLKSDQTLFIPILGTPDRGGLINLNILNTETSGSVPIEAIDNTYLFGIAGQALPSTSPPTTLILPPNYQVEMKITYKTS